MASSSCFSISCCSFSEDSGLFRSSFSACCSISLICSSVFLKSSCDFSCCFCCSSEVSFFLALSSACLSSCSACFSKFSATLLTFCSNCICLKSFKARSRSRSILRSLWFKRSSMSEAFSSCLRSNNCLSCSYNCFDSGSRSSLKSF